MPSQSGNDSRSKSARIACVLEELELCEELELELELKLDDELELELELELEDDKLELELELLELDDKLDELNSTQNSIFKILNSDTVGCSIAKIWISESGKASANERGNVYTPFSLE